MCFATVPITSEAQFVQKRKNDPTSKFIGSYKKKSACIWISVKYLCLRLTHNYEQALVFLTWSTKIVSSVV